MSHHQQRTDASFPSLLIADPHTLLAEALASAAVQAGYTESRTAHDLRSLYAIINAGWDPDIFVIAFELASPDQFSLVQDLLSQHPRSRIILMVRERELEDLKDEIVQSFSIGVMGIISKEYGISSLLKVIEVVAGGEAAIPRDLATAVVNALRLGPTLVSNDVGLTERQREVLALLAQGLTDREISNRLEISLPTVRSHIEAIFSKTGTGNRTAAANWATRHLRVVSFDDN